MPTHDKILGLGGAVMAAALLTGCSIRLQAPIREVAYDFSDRDFYDRSYAPSPQYAPSREAVEERADARVGQAPPPTCDGTR